MLVAKGMQSVVWDDWTFSVINSFDDEVAGGEPTAVVFCALAGGDAIGQKPIVIDSDFIEPDAVPAETLSAISRGLVDVEGGNEVMIAGSPFEAALCREPYIATCPAHGGNLLSADIITTRFCKDENIGMLCLGGAHNSRDTIAAGVQAV